ncbi:MAG: glycosyltransferase [Candidatus Auribacterota bacterium]|nr:glycosyltransferase [Candidatus Auribacterota bacterium]
MNRTLKNTFQARKDRIREDYERLVSVRDDWTRRNRYYYRELIRIIKNFIEPDGEILQIGCGNGFLLSSLSGRLRVGVDLSPGMIDSAGKQHPGIDFQVADAEDLPDFGREFDYILMVNVVGDIVDVQDAFDSTMRCCRPDSRVLIVYYNYLWEPLVKFATACKLKINEPIQNWLSSADIKNLLALSGFETVKKDNFFLCPLYIPGVSFVINRLIARLPLINRLCFLNLIVARPRAAARVEEDYTCSVIVPCKDEVGNIESVLLRVPEMGKGTEIIFVDDKSVDGTGDEVVRLMRVYPEKDVVLVEGPGRGKFEAVKAGFDRASGDIMMILDADATVMPEELPKFFRALVRGDGEFINGCRLVYDMDKQAMRMLNIIGNKLFSLVFSYLLSRRVKDTLCGTKAFFRKDYLRMKKYFGYFGDYDRWGDFNLLFSACKLNLKITEMPVHYTERIEGETKMNRRFSHGWLMLRMCREGAKRLKFHF